MAIPKKSPTRPGGETFKPQNMLMIDSESTIVKQEGASWETEDHADAVGGRFLKNDETDEYLKLEFVGTTVWIRFLFSGNSGYAAITIDETEYPDINLYEKFDTFKIVCVAQGLTKGTHTIKVNVDGTKDALSNNYWVKVDAFYIELDVGALQVLAQIQGVVPIIGEVDTESITPRTFIHHTFDETLVPWVHEGTGSLARDTSRAVLGEASVKLTTGTTAGDTAYMMLNITFSPAKKVAASCFFTLPEDGRYWGIGPTSAKPVYVYSSALGTVLEVIAALRYDIVNEKWQATKSSDGTWDDITGGDIPLAKDPDVWHYFYFEADITGEFLKMYCNTHILNLEGLGFGMKFSAAPTQKEQGGYKIWLVTNIDDAVFTNIDEAKIKEVK